MPGGEPSTFPEVGQELGEGRTGDAGATLEVSRRPGRHGRTDDPEACLLPANPGRSEHGRLACPGLSDHEVVAVARGEQGPDPVGLFDIQMAVKPEHLVGKLPPDPTGTFARSGPPPTW